MGCNEMIQQGEEMLRKILKNCLSLYCNDKLWKKKGNNGGLIPRSDMKIMGGI